MSDGFSQVIYMYKFVEKWFLLYGATSFWYQAPSQTYWTIAKMKHILVL